MNTDSEKPNKLLHEELSYKVRGAILEVSKKYGKGLKESIYENALDEEFTKRGLKFKRQPTITIFSLDSGEPLGTYRPDFLVEELLIVEIKAADFTSPQFTKQQLSYLQASKYELGFLVNFNSPQLFIKRLIYTNDRKPAFRVAP